MQLRKRRATSSFDSKDSGMDGKDGKDGRGATSRMSEAARVAAVPKKINMLLAERKRGQTGAGFELVSGQFEFVHDQADGTLWMVNATRLFARRTRPKQEDNGPEEEEVRYFEEEDFAALIASQESHFEELMKKYGGGHAKDDPANPGVPLPPGNRARTPIKLKDQDRLAGKRVPPELYKFIQAEDEMIRYYQEDVQVQVLRESMKSRTKALWEKAGGRAVGLHVWFHRWVRGCNKVGRRPQRHRPPSGTRPTRSATRTKPAQQG